MLLLKRVNLGHLLMLAGHGGYGLRLGLLHLWHLLLPDQFLRMRQLHLLKLLLLLLL